MRTPLGQFLSLRLAAALAGAALFPGCANQRAAVLDPAHFGPFFIPQNFGGDPRLPGTLRRVLLLPVHGGAFASEETSESLDPIFAEALGRQMRFEVVTLPRQECEKSFGVSDISSTEPLPAEFLASLGSKYAAQAVLFVDLTAYEAYRPMTLGLRAKLASVDDRRLIWNFDQIFSTSDPTVVNSVRRHYQKNELGPVPFDLSVNALRSPGRFAAYAAETAFKTLPPR